MTRLVALYPRTWRDRYEAEFLALLSDRPPDPLDRIDIVRGAIDARLHPQMNGVPESPADEPSRASWTARRSGWLTFVGGVLWIAALVVAINGPIVTDGWGTYRDGMAAHPLLFTALGFLGIGMVTVAVGLPASAHRARRAALIGGLSGLLWAFAPWLFPAGLIASGCLTIVALGAWGAGHWSRSEFALLVAGVAAAWSFLPLSEAHLLPLTLDMLVPFFLALSLAWFAVGHALVRGVPRTSPSTVDSKPA